MRRSSQLKIFQISSSNERSSVSTTHLRAAGQGRKEDLVGLSLRRCGCACLWREKEVVRKHGRIP